MAKKKAKKAKKKKAKKKKAKTKTKKRKKAQGIVEHVIGYVEASGVLEGRRGNKKLTFTGMIFNQSTGALTSIYERLVDDIEILMEKKA